MQSRRRYFFVLGIVALLGFLAAIYMVFFSRHQTVKKYETPYIHMVQFENYVYGLGRVIPKSEEIRLTLPYERRIVAVYAKEGEKVKKGEPLIQLDRSDLDAQLAADNVVLAKAKMEYQKLKMLPRKEDLEEKEALVNEAQISYNEANRLLELAQGLFDQNAISIGELNHKKYQKELEKAKLNFHLAQMNKVLNGAWAPDLQLARLEIQYSKEKVEFEKRKIAKMTLKAPIDGTILQVKVHPGEIANPNSKTPMIVMGDISECYVKVAIDQNDAVKIHSNSPATGFFRGANAIPIPLEFVRIEPLMVPKQYLSGSKTEKVDTFVLNVIYRFKNRSECDYINQEMDVYIQVKNEKT